jgi:hypothetical protein
MKRRIPVTHYQELTARERFQLVLAASGRGDDAEADRLAATGGRMLLSFYGHAPYVQAFVELGSLVFLELLELAAQYTLARTRVAFRDAEKTVREAGAEEQPDTPMATETAGEDAEDSSSSVWWLDRALAFGFSLQTRADGWRLFCDRFAIPPFVLLDRLPGYDRLHRALALAEKVAFGPEGMARWLNRSRPAGAAEVTVAMLITPAQIAAELDEQFHAIAARWGGGGHRG